MAKLLSTFIVCVFAVHSVLPLPHEKLYPYGDQVQDNRLPSGDEVSSPEIQLSVPIVFYENVYSSIFVNDNGLLSFVTEVPAFFNAQFPLTFPIIAPFYADVDIRATGQIRYRETTAAELLDRASADIQNHVQDGTAFRPTSLFIASWLEVGRYSEKSDKKNTFQVVIASNGQESYVLFLYLDGGIQWIQGDGKIASLPDARAQAGFMSGDGRMYTLHGSGSDRAFNFDRTSNTRPRQRGLWIFRLGNSGAGGNVRPASEGPAGRQQQETCSTADDPCPPTAVCTDYPGGYCCSCSSGYFGNGRSCLLNNEAQRLNGKVSGVVNDVQLDQIDLHAYINSEEGRTYTALSRVPPSIGYDMQSVLAVGDVIGWLFAKSRSGLPNGFTQTGGVFNRTAEVNFPQTGHRVVVDEQFFGPDVFNYLRAKVVIKGTLPSVSSGSKIEVIDYSQEQTLVGPGHIRSHVSRSFKLEGNSVEIPFTVDENISFESCTSLPADRQTNALRLDVSKNFIVYDEKDQIVRFAASYKTSPVSANDPCRQGDLVCGQHASCIVDGDAPRCVCERGYEQLIAGVDGQETSVCEDIDECATGRHRCHQFADCFNTAGSFACRCKAGFAGDGTFCQQELTCDELACDINGECVQGTSRQPECRCKPGFRGNGYFCQRDAQTPDATSATDCGQDRALCDVHAECVPDPYAGGHICLCKPGYQGPGSYCVQNPTLCQYQCGDEAECRFNQTQAKFNCICRSGFEGDGFSCLPTDGSAVNVKCAAATDCHHNAMCVFEERLNDYRCNCNQGYVGDGQRCTQSTEAPDCSTNNFCSSLADCVYNESDAKNTCVCRPGYMGDGILCLPVHECIADTQCQANALCVFHQSEQKNKCKCNEGYLASGKECAVDPNAPCNLVGNCDANAACLFDVPSRQYKCTCKAGYKGSGKECEKAMIPCNILNNCDPRAQCAYSFADQGFRCQCNDGYRGDGLTCRPNKPCNEDPLQCDATNAECLYFNEIGGYACQCRAGFVGDGLECREAPKHIGDYLIFAQGMSLLKLPQEPSQQNVGKLLLTKAHQIPVGLDVDCLHGHVYWSDISRKAINRMSYNGSWTETVFEGEPNSPEGIAIDWIARNIYWTDSYKDTISVAQLNSTNKNAKTLIKDGLVDPRGIVVHPGLGRMFWSDWNRNSPKIESGNMDGSNRATFLALAESSLPNMLAIDYITNDLCWTDAGLKRIECISLNGQSRRVVYTPAAYPFDLTLAGNYIFWTDWELKNVQRVDRNGGDATVLELPLGGNGKIYGIVTIPEQCPRMSNPCAVKNGGCQHICLPSGRGSRTCVCPDVGGEDCVNELIT